ncbi:MAG: hypothetical protein ACLTWG_04945 [Blautia sp.]|uniref:hypothetical protein n=1 Tax=Blautia sp. TaxID=1955243 RepID=UPI00399462C6
MLERIMELQLLLYVMTVLGVAGGVGMLAVHLTYRRAMGKTKAVMNLKEKWLSLWKTRDKLMNRMNLLVWLPSLMSSVCLGLALFLTSRLKLQEGLSLQYLYIGTAVPILLLLLRQALDFTYREELVMNSLADYILQARARREDAVSARKAEPVAVSEKMDSVLQEEMVEKITASIRQTAATGSHFSKMLSPEEEEIMREIIREFMD